MQLTPPNLRAIAAEALMSTPHMSTLEIRDLQDPQVIEAAALTLGRHLMAMLVKHPGGRWFTVSLDYEALKGSHLVVIT